MTKTRIHWTQTPAGKRRLAELKRERREHSNGRQGTTLSNDIAQIREGIAAAASDAATPAPEAKPLGLKVRNAVRDIADTFLAFAHSFAAVTTKRDEFAPRFMKVFEMWREETNGGLAAFVRLFDESVPTKTADYKKHSAYMAADYLRRKVADAERAAQTSKRGRKRKKPASPRHALVRLVSSILPLFAEAERDTLVDAMAKRLNWSEDQARNIITDAADESPIIVVRAPRGVHVDGELKVALAPEPTRGKTSAAA